MGISATKEGNEGAVTGAIGFSSHLAVSLAVPAIQGQVAKLVGTVDAADGTGVTREGNMIRFRARVKLSADLLGRFGLLGVP